MVLSGSTVDGAVIRERVPGAAQPGRTLGSLIKYDLYISYRTAHVRHPGDIEQRHTHRIRQQDARTYEHPQHADLCQSGRTQIERGHAEPTGAHGMVKLKRPQISRKPSNLV